MNLKIPNRFDKKSSHIEPRKWNKLINNKETFLLDVRKPFENRIGSFKKSVNPDINNFKDFPKYLKKLKKNQSIAMFCTGGIRCEKASIYLKKRGFKKIYQLKGGLRSSMGYIGAKNLIEISKNAKFTKITKAGFYESMVHSVEMTQKTINFKL